MTMKYGWHHEQDEPFACNTCGVKPCVNPRFCRLCRIADKRRRTQNLEQAPQQEIP